MTTQQNSLCSSQILSGMDLSHAVNDLVFAMVEVEKATKEKYASIGGQFLQLVAISLAQRTDLRLKYTNFIAFIKDLTTQIGNRRQAILSARQLNSDDWTGSSSHNFRSKVSTMLYPYIVKIASVLRQVLDGGVVFWENCWGKVVTESTTNQATLLAKISLIPKEHISDFLKAVENGKDKRNRTLLVSQDGRKRKRLRNQSPSTEFNEESRQRSAHSSHQSSVEIQQEEASQQRQRVGDARDCVVHLQGNAPTGTTPPQIQPEVAPAGQFLDCFHAQPSDPSAEELLIPAVSRVFAALSALRRHSAALRQRNAARRWRILVLEWMLYGQQHSGGFGSTYTSTNTIEHCTDTASSPYTNKLSGVTQATSITGDTSDTAASDTENTTLCSEDGCYKWL